MLKSILPILMLLFTLTVIAQKKVQKPIKLQAKTENHKISFEIQSDIFYFTAADLITFFKSTTDDSEAAAHYLKNYHKEIEFKKGQTNFSNAGERALYNSLEKHLKAIFLSGKASDIVKEGNKLNLFILTTKCASDTSKQTITEKKGRVILDCI